MDVETPPMTMLVEHPTIAKEAKLNVANLTILFMGNNIVIIRSIFNAYFRLFEAFISCLLVFSRVNGCTRLK